MSTNTSTGRLMLAVLGGVAELERDLIRTHTSEGRTRAIAQGKKMGRPCQITHTQRQDIIEQRRNGKTFQEIADIFAISSGTVSRIVAGKNGYKSEKSKG